MLRRLSDRTNSSLLLLPTLIPILFFMRHYVPTSFWLDEGITYWITNDSFNEVWTRSLNFQGQSPFYFSIVYFFRQCLGDSEISLRTPSLLAFIGTMLYLYRTGSLLTSKEAGLFACTMYCVTVTSVYPILIDARPYGIATFLATASTFYLIRYTTTHDYLSLIAYFISSVSLFYAHYLFAHIFLFHALYIPIAQRTYKRLPPRSHMTFLLLGALLSLILALPHLHAIAKKAAIYAFAPSPSFGWFFREAIPLPYLTLFLSSLLIAKLVPGSQRDFLTWHKLTQRQTLAILTTLLWSLLPLLGLTLQSISSSSVMLPRYALSRIPGLCLLLGILANSQLRGMRKTLFPLATCLLLVGSVLFKDITYRNEDWESAFQYIHEQTHESETDPTIFLLSGLVEAKSAGWIASTPRADAYLTSIATAYQQKGRVYPLFRNENLSQANSLFLSQTNISSGWILSRGYQDLAQLNKQLPALEVFPNLRVDLETHFGIVYIYKLIDSTSSSDGR